MDSHCKQASARKHRRFTTTPVMRKSLAYRAMLRLGWVEVGENDDWDFFWADVYSIGTDSGFEVSTLRDHQKLNHFPRHTELTRKHASSIQANKLKKDALVKNLKRAKKSLEREGKNSAVYDFFPQTFVLPQEYGMFAEEFRKAPGQVWIMKPCGRSQGQGINLVNRVRQVFAWRKLQEGKAQPEAYVISRYIHCPLLIGGRKFDLRLYVLVTSFAPLKIYLYRGGFCRFSCGQYDSECLERPELHLTNVAVQRRQGAYNSITGMKWPLSSLRKYLQGKLGQSSTDQVFKGIQEVVVRSLLAVRHVVTADRHCFELFGYDVLLDRDLKAWLLEVNASPSLNADTAADLKLKSRMLEDVLRLLDSIDTSQPVTGG